MAITETIPFNFDELYTGLEQKFVDAGIDTSPGSNTSQLITAMAYFTSMLNVNTAVNINETMLSLATKRDNVLANARAIGYEIKHKQSFTYDITFELLGSPNGTYTIPKYSVFSEGGKNYYYMGPQLEIQSDGLQTISVIEGTLHKYIDFPDSLSVTTQNVVNETDQTVPQSFIDIPFVDIEENGIECFVTYFDAFGTRVIDEEWTKSNIYVGTNINNKFFRVDNIGFRTPRIYFELANAGSGIKVGTTVNFNVLQSSGSTGAMVAPDKPLGIKHAIANATITTVNLVSTGAEEESLTSVQANAPKFYNSANRAVTTNDYVAICNRQAAVKDSLVWGGDEELPKSPGHIWFSFLPATTRRAFSSDTFKTNFNLNESSYTAWDYTIDEQLNASAFTAQVNAANAYYAIRYIEDSEIISTQVNSAGDLVQPGIWDTLNEFKIPTMQFHNRHPIFLDFEYDIEILKYNIVTSKANIFQNVFDSIDNFFTGTNDVITTEKFKSEYLHSTLEKRIDGVLSDAAGFTSTLKTSILLTQKNVVNENALSASGNYDYRDIYIPLATPLNAIFDANGFLITAMLPSIDTASFIDERSTSDIAGGVNIPTTNLYTDWTSIHTDISNGVTQQDKKIIVAPVYVDITETVNIVATSPFVTLTNIDLYPDDPTSLDVTGATIVYDRTTITKTTSAGVVSVLTEGTDWTISPLVDSRKITFATPVNTGDTIKVDTAAVAGSYMIVNGFTRYITVQLYVDATGFSAGQATNVIYDSPKSYLTTNDGLYDYTTDQFYLTTNGYSETTIAQSKILVGTIVKTISPSLYYGSPLKMQLFRRDRFIDLKYNSQNFQLERNVIPRLKRVSFK